MERLSILMVVLLVVLLASCRLANPESGDKIGQIAKVQDEGLICNTTSVLITGKYGGGELQLTVPNTLFAQVKHFNETQEFVKVTFHTDLFASVCSNDTNNRFLDSVEAHPVGAPNR